MNRHGAAVGAVAGTLVGIGMATAPLWASIVFVLGVLYLVGYGAAVRSGAIPAPPALARIVGGRPEPGRGDPVASLARRWARDAVRDPDWWERQGCLTTAEVLRGRGQRPRGYLALTTKGGGRMLRLACGCRQISHPAHPSSVDPCTEHRGAVLIGRKDCGCQSWEMGDGSRREAACTRHQQLGRAAHVRLPVRPTAPPPPPPPPAPRRSALTPAATKVASAARRERERATAAGTSTCTCRRASRAHPVRFRTFSDPPCPVHDDVPRSPEHTRRETAHALWMAHEPEEDGAPEWMFPEPEGCGAAECVVVRDPDTGERLGAVHSRPGASLACPRDGWP